MTRKDYVLLAAAISSALPEIRSTYTNGQYVTARLAGAIATALESDNPKFDRARFLKACGVQS